MSAETHLPQPSATICARSPRMIIPASDGIRRARRRRRGDPGRHPQDARPRRGSWCAQALDDLARLAGKPLAELDPARREAVAQRIPRQQAERAAATLVRVVLQCYYRDDRVVRSLGLEPRAPFPKGYVLEEGDWSLLDPVKAMTPNLRA